MNKNLKNIETILIALFVTMVIISSSSISVTLNEISESNNHKLDADEEELIINRYLTGLAPRNNKEKPVFETAIKDNNELNAMVSNNKESLSDTFMYGYNAYASGISEGPVFFNITNPGSITLLAPTSSGDFMSGGTWMAAERWICCEYGSGAFWEIDPDDGTMDPLGGGGLGLNSLAYNPCNHQIYGIGGSDDLYTIDFETGQTVFIGNCGIGETIIGLAFDEECMLYGWDAKFSGESYLYTIDIETGEATKIGSMGMTLCYAQDGDFLFEEDRLFLTAYIYNPQYGGYLIEVDKETAESTIIGEFQGSAEIDASIFKNTYTQFENNIGIRSIINPENGDAEKDMAVTVKVKNYGNNTEGNVSLSAVILKDGIYEEYNETIYIDVLDPGEEKEIELPIWTPDDWQSVSNNYTDYKITAHVTLSGDQYPDNDYKEKWFVLYFRYLHDVGCVNLSGPESGLAQTFPVSGTIKNFGQYEECCFKTNVEITEIDNENLEELLSQDFSDSTFPPDGWAKTHANWMYSNSNLTGGEPGEARFYYAPVSTDLFRFYTPAINTSENDAIIIEFKQNVEHFTTPYTLQVETSKDGINWEVVWFITPISSIVLQDISIITAQNVGSNTYVSWTFNGNSYNINDWYIDNVIIQGYNYVESEYQDYKCTTTIAPGEEQTFEFDDWTPEFLSEETTAEKKYIIKAWTNIEEPADENPDNDLFLKIIELEFIHDVGIKEVTSPSNSYHGGLVDQWLHFDDGNPVNAIAPCGCPGFEYAIRLTPDELADWAGYQISFVKRFHGYNRPFWMYGKIKIYDEGTSKHPGDLITEEPFECYENDWHEVELSEPVYISGGKDIWVSVDVIDFKPHEYPAAMDGCQNYQGKGDWIYFADNWVEISIYGFSTDWNLWAGVTPSEGGPSPDTYIQPGYQDINVTIENIGTFPEPNLTCYAEIYEYITNCTNGTLVYEDNITDIDLDTPLGGTEFLSFNNYNFAIEGPYGLLLNLSDDNDDITGNNEYVLGIGVDATQPYSIHTLQPATPDGDNGWYVSDLEVTIYAYDPGIGCGFPGSGVKEIKYKINNGTTKTINRDKGSFIVDVDAEGLTIDYWAVDNAGNEESHHIFTIDMDQTDPLIDLTYSWIDGPDPSNWWMIFTANVTDETSKVDRVEFYLNDVLQDTVIGPGPEYIWQFLYSGGLHITIKAVAYDKAGNIAYDKVIDPENINVNLQQYQSSKILQLIQKNSYKLLFF